jgi:uncharacterized membrane protein
MDEVRQWISIVAVAGAWLAGAGVLFSVLSFAFAVINPRLVRFGVIWLLLTDAGLIAMMGACLILIPNDKTALWVSCIIGIIVLIAITGAAFYVYRETTRKESRTNQLIDVVRSRIEF